jgi:hypothetical protein
MISGEPGHLLTNRDVPRSRLGWKLLKQLSAATFIHRFSVLTDANIRVARCVQVRNEREA